MIRLLLRLENWLHGRWPAAANVLLDRRWRRYMSDLTAREADAKRRGETRALGQVRRERRERVHGALSTATGWRGRDAR